jgi:hypothetical protein
MCVCSAKKSAEKPALLDEAERPVPGLMPSCVGK